MTIYIEPFGVENLAFLSFFKFFDSTYCFFTQHKHLLIDGYEFLKEIPKVRASIIFCLCLTHHQEYVPNFVSHETHSFFLPFFTDFTSHCSFVLFPGSSLFPTSVHPFLLFLVKSNSIFCSHSSKN